MSGQCGNCDCADKSQCAKGNQYTFSMVEDAKSYDAMSMEGGETCGQCKCGSGCDCTTCTCCTH